MNFIIWIYLEDPIRVGENKNLLKTIPIDASPPKAGVAIQPFCHCEASRKGSRGNLEFLLFYLKIEIASSLRSSQ
jgi:hypothetical protein